MVNSNRRSFPRYLFTVAVSLFQNEYTYRCNECRNISRGGMCVILNEYIIIRGEISVVISKMYNGTLINFEALCNVAWQDMQGGYDNSRMLGLEFISIDYSNLQALEQLLSFSSMTPELVW